MKKLFFLFVLLSGCTGSPEFNPPGVNLSEATVGESYITKIQISKAKVIMNSFSGEFEKENTGLIIENCEYPPERESKFSNTDFNCALIKGIPKHPGVIRLTIYGDLHGNMFSPSSSFEKKYTITVRDK